MANVVAPEGQVWVCGACGKRSRDQYGFQKISPGWDEACMLNAVLCYEGPLVTLRGENTLVAVRGESNAEGEALLRTQRSQPKPKEKAKCHRS